MRDKIMRSRNKEWVAKMQAQPNLIWLDLSEEDKTDRLHALLHAILKQYTLTYPIIQKRLLCSRDWVTANILYNVPHIFINARTLAVLKTFAEKEGMISDNFSFPTSYYFFDEIEFTKWLRKNTTADRQTIIIDLSKYSPVPNYCQKCILLYNNYEQSQENNKKELLREYNDYVFSSLNEEGQNIYLRRIQDIAKREGEWGSVPFFSVPEDLVSQASMRDVYPNRERFVRQLYKVGAVRYTISSSLVRYSKEEVFKEIKPHEIVVRL